MPESRTHLLPKVAAHADLLSTSFVVEVVFGWPGLGALLLTAIFARDLHVYGREGLPCTRCGRTIVRTSFMNRSSYTCPRCQRRPRTRSSVP